MMIHKLDMIPYTLSGPLQGLIHCGHFSIEVITFRPLHYAQKQMDCKKSALFNSRNER